MTLPLSLYVRFARPANENAVSKRTATELVRAERSTTKRPHLEYAVAMALIQFVQNYEDLSTDQGYQFKFFCDKCHNGFMTHFQASTMGMAESALKVAGNLFGGFFNTASNSAYEIQRAIGGPAHDAALEAAVKEGKQHF